MQKSNVSDKIFEKTEFVFFYDSDWDITSRSSLFRVNILKNFQNFIGVNMIKRKKAMLFDIFVNFKDTRMPFTLDYSCYNRIIKYRCIV